MAQTTAPLMPSELSPDQIQKEIDAAARVNPLREYVATGGTNVVTNYPYLQRLPTPDDDLETLLGNDTYSRMMNDPQVSASLLLLIMMVVRREISLDPSIADENEDDAESHAAYQKALEVRDHCQRALESLRRNSQPIQNVLFEMLFNALPYGSAVAEKLLMWGDGKDANKYVYKSIKVKPRQAYAYVVDPFFNLVGLAVYTGPYDQWVTDTANLIKDGLFIGTGALETGWKLIEREHFCVLSVLTKNHDPRGRSWLRSVYNAWYQKMKQLQRLETYCARFGLPWVVGETADNAQAQYPQNKDGTENKTGGPESKITPQYALLSSISQLMGGGNLVTPYGAKVHITQPGGDGGMMLGVLGYHDTQIVKGITFQKLATSPDAHQAKSAGEIHQDVLNSPVFYLKNLVTAMVERDILAPLVEENYGPTYRNYVPRASLGRIAPEDLPALLTAIGKALASGGLHYSMLPEIWADFGLPRADMAAWIKEIKEERDAMIRVDTVNSKAPATGATPSATGTTATTAATSQTDQQRYDDQEIGKAKSRTRARRASGRLGATFSNDLETALDGILQFVPPEHHEEIEEIVYKLAA